ncbi:MAG: hypothetical protein GX163_00055 [Bacteroidetes bacterium]|jgi:hypothetical protein|nr:hypothetical protein [Bacteroidota bacterium]
MNLTKTIVVFLTVVIASFQSVAQLINTVSAEGGMLIAARIDGVTIRDKQALFDPQCRRT